MSTSHDRPEALALAEAAHELRAPLGGIEAMAQLLGETELTPAQARLVAGLKASTAHLRAVAGDIIDRSRGMKALPGQSAQAFVLSDVIDSVAAAAEARALAKGLEFRAERDESWPTELTGDPRRIRQMLENLLDNAFKVTRDGGVTLSVRQVDRRGAFVGLMFEVTDTGPGIALADRDKLFKTFSRIDNGVGGNGLGLAMVARMARAMGGDAGCASEPGHGASFWFTLRLKTAATAPAPAPEAEDAPVLVVDDNQANRMIMAAILEHFGHRIVEAATGEDALRIIGETPVKAVMLDQTLPGISGLEVLAAIRAMDGALGALAVIPVTGRVFAEDKAAFAAAGADGFVEKPVNAKAVRDALEAALARRAGDRAAA
jgi:CheY-like chemotaxis protein